MDNVEIRWGRVEDAAGVLSLLQAVATWLSTDGPGALWPASTFRLEEIEDQARHSHLVVATHGGQLVASAYATSTDRVFWPEASPGEALYVHKLVVSRAFAGHGISGHLLDWIAGEARRRGCRFVRLDCALRPKLLSVYARAGYSPVGTDVEIHGFTVRRLQRKVDT